MQCPTCDQAMQAQTLCGETIERCFTCDGEFCTHQTLRRLLSAHAPAPGAPAGAYVRPSPLSDPVRYRKCPACRDMMLRKNFRDSSGIVVDVCSAHGIWFDRGELGMVFKFVATGAFAKAERDTVRRSDARRRLDVFERDLRKAGPRHYIGSHMAGSVEGLADIAMLVPDLDSD
jgi:Zn-finger nucleic acid-binding protein